MLLLTIYQQLFVHFETCHFDLIDPSFVFQFVPCVTSVICVHPSVLSRVTHDVAFIDKIFHVRLLNKISGDSDTKAVFTAPEFE